MQQQTVTATVFIPPNGRREVIEIKKVYSEDAEYIKAHNIKVSLEELMTGETVIYFDDGKRIDDDPTEEPDEIIVFARGRTCEETIAEGVIKLKKRATHHNTCD